MEHIKLETIPNNSFENILEHIEKNGELPDMTQEELGRLYDTMSEDDVVQYYQTIRVLPDEARKEVLEKWTPRPRILYHGSHVGGIDTFEPRDEKKRNKGDPPLVFASPLEVVSSGFLLGHSNEDISGSYDGGKTWVLVATSLEDLKKRDRPGFIYNVSPEAFGVHPEEGLGFFEWTSKNQVPAINEKKVDSALEYMLGLGFKIYVPSQEVSMEEFRQGDQASLINKMRRITLEDIKS